MLSLLSISAMAESQSISAATEEQTVRALGIMNGDENGNMNLANNVTRAEFVKMMVAASVYKDNAGENTNMLLYRDVEQNHWAVGYIKVAADEGWIVGYADGTFRPNNTITLQEAASALLRLLGYTSDDLSGLFPTAQMNKFIALGLSDGLTKTQTQDLTRYDCVTIFYNLMNADTESGSVCAKTLGYALNSEGKLDYSALVSADMKGPFVLESGDSLTSILPFTTTNLSVYKNGDTATLSSAATYDVYYYNENLRTVWLYDRKVSGIYTAVSPSSAAPASVTVAGNNYDIGTSEAAYKLSVMGGFSVGDTITLLLGMNGTVVDVVQASDVSGIYYGVVTSKQTNSYTDNNGKIVSEDIIQIACTDGILRQYTGSASVGNLVSVNCSGGQTSIDYLSRRSTSGKINSAGTKLGSLSFSDDVEIMDTNSNGEYARIYPSRLAGVSLDSDDVRYYGLDENGDINRLILNDATGDVYSYGLLTSVTESSYEMSMSSYYEYIINGTAGALSSTTKIYNVSTGGAIFRYKDGAISSIKNLKNTTINSVNDLYAMNGNHKYLLSDNIQVYEKIDDSYCLTNISTIADTNKYSLSGYYDDFGYNAGGRLRIIVATTKPNETD
jgi:hypothetical protein